MKKMDGRVEWDWFYSSIKFARFLAEGKLVEFNRSAAIVVIANWSGNINEIVVH